MYMEIATGTKRKENKFSIHLTTSFTPRTTGSGEFKRLARELLMYATQFAPKTLLLPWKENTIYGPINQDDLNNPSTFNDTIKHYFDNPPYITLQPGTPAYRIGF